MELVARAAGWDAGGVGSRSLPFPFSLSQDPPYFTVLPGWEYRQEAGRELLIPCAAAGDPFPIIAWRKVPGLPDKSAVPLAFGEYCRQRSHTLSR